jgi:hypothetical protein
MNKAPPLPWIMCVCVCVCVETRTSGEFGNYVV